MNYEVQVVLHTSSDLPRDRIVNTFAITSESVLTPAEDGALIVQSVGSWLDALAGEGILSEWYTGVADVIGYDLDDPSATDLGSPVFFETGTGVPGSGNSLPVEVALCVSFIHDNEPLVVPARRRGRMYLGPLGVSTMTGDAPPRPSDETCQFIADEFANFLSALAGDSFGFTVWSRMEDNLFFVDRAWVDNEFDTIRSRGLESTARFTPS